MNLNTAPATGANDGAVMISSPSPSRRSRGWRVLFAVPIAWLIALTLGASPASAATVSNVWSPGGVTFYQASNYTAQVFRTGALYPTPTAAVNVPGPVVGRSAARATYQTVRSTTYIQKWNGASWVVVGTPWSSTTVLAPGSYPVRFAPKQLATGAGYFNVVLQVTWSDQYGTLGTKTLNYAHASDYRCAISYCFTGPGYFYIA